MEIERQRAGELCFSLLIFLLFLGFFFSYNGLVSHLSLPKQINFSENFGSTLILKFRCLLGQQGCSFEIRLSLCLGLHLEVRKNKCVERYSRHFP